MLVYYTDNNKSLVRGFDGICYKDYKDYHTAQFKPNTEQKRPIFELMSGFEANDEGLKAFRQSLTIWSAQIEAEISTTRYSYTGYWKQLTAIIELYKKLQKPVKQEPMSITEMNWMERCHNGGLVYTTKQEVKNAEAYDFKCFYAENLGGNTSLRLPTGAGREEMLKELPEKLKAGYYRVKITSEDADVCKVFAYCTEQVYTHISIKHARELQKRFDIKIELIVDDKPNAYLYEKTTRSTKLFGKWFSALIGLKAKYPDNKLVKLILSATYGFISRHTTLYVDYDDDEKLAEIEARNDVVFYDLNLYKQKEQLVYKTTETAFNYRLVPFLTSYSRAKMGRTIIDHIDKVVRVWNDGVIFSEPTKMEVDTLVREEKYCGHLILTKGRKPVKV